MKWKDFKLAAHVEGKIATLAAKKKNGLRVTYSDTAVNSHIANFSAFLGGLYVNISFQQAGKKWKVVITFPTEDGSIDPIHLTAKTQSQFKLFMSTDYDGFKLK